MESHTELHHQFCPQTLDDVIGQDDAVAAIRHKLDTATMPHTVLLAAPSGSGKTTLAHIIARELGVLDDDNLTVVNCADARDIDSIREIIASAMQLSLGNKRRVWIMEEAVQIPKASQQAFLKMTEKPPIGVYFIFCASDTTGLIPTLLSRCWQPPLKELKSDHVAAIIQAAVETLGIQVSPKVLKALMDKAGTNARLAFQLLETIITTDDEDKQLIFVGATGTTLRERCEFLGSLLMKSAPWKELRKCINLMEPREAESASYAILAFATKILLNDNDPAKIQRAREIVIGFQADFTKSMTGGLAVTALEICLGYAKK